MGYYIEDAKGEWVADLATNFGIVELRNIGPNLDKFLNTGVADKALAAEIVKDTIGHPRAGYIADILQPGGIRYPIIITDGLGPGDETDEDEDEDLVEHHEPGGKPHDQDEHGNWAKGQKKFKFAEDDEEDGGEPPKKKKKGAFGRALEKVKPGEIEEEGGTWHGMLITESHFQPVEGRGTFRANTYLGRDDETGGDNVLRRVTLPGQFGSGEGRITDKQWDRLVAKVDQLKEALDDSYDARNIGEFQFNDDQGQFVRTGRGDAKAIFSHVSAEFINHLTYNSQYNDMGIMTFSGEGESRQKLYRFLSDRVENILPNWKGYQLDKGHFAIVDSNWEAGDGVKVGGRIQKLFQDFVNTREEAIKISGWAGVEYLEDNPR